MPRAAPGAAPGRAGPRSVGRRRAARVPLTAAALTACVGVLASGCSQAPDAFDLVVGDCLALPSGESVQVVEPQPCDGPHGAEVFAVLAVADEDWPGDDEIAVRAQRGCADAFEGYVGAPYAASDLLASSLTPTVDSWGQGDRAVICFLYADGELLEGSQRGEAAEG